MRMKGGLSIWDETQSGIANTSVTSVIHSERVEI